MSLSLMNIIPELVSTEQSFVYYSLVIQYRTYTYLMTNQIANDHQWMFEELNFRHQQEDLLEDDDNHQYFRLSQINLPLFSDSPAKQSDRPAKNSADRIFQENEEDQFLSSRNLQPTLQELPTSQPHSHHSHPIPGPENTHKDQAVRRPPSRAVPQVDRIKFKRNGEKQVNGCSSKNFIPFIWRKIKKALGASSIRHSAWWKQLMKMKPSLQLLNRIFKHQNADISLRHIFENKCFLREIMLSPIHSCQKKVYVKLLRVVHKGLERKRIDWLR